jgi:hypothetical protein
VWTIDVGNLDAKNKKMAQEDGLNVKNKGDDRGDFVTIKRKVKNKRGDCILHTIGSLVVNLECLLI